MALTCALDSTPPPPPPPAAGTFVDIASSSGMAAIKNGLDWCFDVTGEDLDDDGRNDIFIGGHGADRRMAFGNGNGTFTQYAVPTWAAQTWSQMAYDYNNDGRTDFSQNMDSFDGGVLRNDGNRTFTVLTAGQSIRTAGNGMAWSDWNGDGRPDYMVNGFNDNAMYSGTGNGTFSMVAGNYGLFGASDDQEASVFLADLTGDGAPDLLVQPLDGSVFDGPGHHPFLARNTTAPLGGTATFAAGVRAGLDGLPGPGIALGDYDNDGDLDVFGMGSGADSLGTVKYGLFRNDGLGHFENVTVAAGLPTTAQAVNVYAVLYVQSVFLDYDGDGMLDILAVETSADRLFRNMGGGVFREVTSAHGLAGSRLAGRPARFFASDLDGDRDIDFVTIRAENDMPCAVQVWRNDVSAPNGLLVKLVGRTPKNAMNSKLYLYEAQSGGGNGPLVGYREVILSHTHRAPLEQHFALPSGKTYNLRVKFWPSGTVVDRADVKPGRTVITEP